MAKRIAIYPGTFDPITLGHMGVIKESSRLFDKVIVGLLVNPAKKPRFTEDKRKTMIEESVADAGLDRVEVKTFKGLAVQLARQEKAIVMIRGLRMTTEYEAELNLALNNQVVGPDITTIFVPPRQEHLHITSTVVRELLSLGYTDLDNYVPQAVLEHTGIMEKRYEARILKVCRDFTMNDMLAGLFRQTLVRCYQESHRAYHALKHINDSLDEFEKIKYILQDPCAVEMAILFHDAIYKAGAKDNEEKSAELAKDLIRKVPVLDSSFIKRVAELIIATKHDIAPTDFDVQVIVDIDLASLGYSEREFDKNAAKIRKEFSWVPEEQFRAGRIAFLKSLLPPNRDTIYLTQFFRDKYEAQAQKNITRAIANLSE